MADQWDDGIKTHAYKDCEHCKGSNVIVVEPYHYIAPCPHCEKRYNDVQHEG